MTAKESPAEDYLTIAQAADRIGAKPWEVVRLIESGQLDTVTLVPVAALRDYAGSAK